MYLNLKKLAFRFTTILGNHLFSYNFWGMNGEMFNNLILGARRRFGRSVGSGLGCYMLVATWTERASYGRAAGGGAR